MPEVETGELLRLREHKKRRAAESSGAIESLDGHHDGGGVGFTRRTWMLFSVMGGLIYGYNVSLAAPLQYIRDDLALSAAQEEAVSATATLSDACSMLVGGYLADRFGRKSTAMFACVCSIVGTLLASVASASVGWLVLWRLCCGVGNGLSILLIPMYISECVDARSRERYVTMYQLGVNAGVALPYLFMIVVSENWRSCLAFGSFPALYVLYNFHFYFPESIKWLRWKANPTTGFDLEIGDDSPVSVADRPSSSEDEDSDETVNSSKTDATNKSNKYQVVDTGSSAESPSTPSRVSRPHLELVIGVLLAYVNNCVDASLFYGPEIIAKTSADFSRRDANVFGLLCSLVAVVSVIVTARFLIERLSRRTLYLACLGVVCACFLVSGAVFARYSTEDFARNPLASTAIMLVFATLNVFAAIGPSVLFVVILSELFQDNSYRARYMSYCTFSMSLISLLVNGSLLTLFETIGTAATFLAYGATYVLCLGFFWVYLPETKQRQLV